MSEFEKVPACPLVARLLSVAQGNWIEALIGCGIPTSKLNGERQSCPRCGGWNRFYALPDVEHHGRVHCDQCFPAATVAEADGISTLQWFMEAPFETAYLGLLSRYDFPGRPASPGLQMAYTKAMKAHSADLRQEDPPPIEIKDFAVDFRYSATIEKRRDCWEAFGLNESSLEQLQVGWSQKHDAFSFPMEDAWGRLSGIKFVSSSQEKTWSMASGEREGLFVPVNLRAPVRRLYIADGPVATAACLSLGLPCVGCSDQLQCYEMLCCKLIELCPLECVYLTDESGMDAETKWKTLGDMAYYSRSSRLAIPPRSHDSIREWLKSCNTCSDVEGNIDACTVLHLQAPSTAAG